MLQGLDRDLLLEAGLQAMAEKHAYWRPELGTLLLTYAKQHVARALERTLREYLDVGLYSDPIDETSLKGA